MSEEKKFDVFDPKSPTVEEQEAAIQKHKEYIETLTERLKGKSLMVATPMYGGSCLGSYTKSCLDLAMICTRIGVPIRFKYIFNESLIQRARNYLVDEFYRSDSTHLLFIDADIKFDARDAISLLSLCGIQEKGKPKYDIIGAPYPKKSIAWEKIYDAAKSGVADNNPMYLSKFVGDFAFNAIDTGDATFKLNEPLEVMETGTGFMCISKEAINKFRSKYPRQKYTPDHARSADFDGSRPIFAVFDCLIDPESNRYLSEDYMFCQWSRKIGLHVWICPWMELGHTGTYTFSGSIAHMAQIGRDITPSGISPDHFENIKKSISKNNCL